MLNRLIAIAFVFIFIVTLASGASAQNRGVNAPPPDGPQIGNRQGVLRELGLSRDQMEKIRAITRERRQVLDAATERLRVANRDLDDAIYADGATDELVQQRMNTVRSAQLEVLTARSTMEFQIRKVLDPEQLRRFREARGRFGNGRGPALQRPVDENGPGSRRPERGPRRNRRGDGTDNQRPNSRQRPPRD